jgi:CBS-domain-containing membrane protein
MFVHEVMTTWPVSVRPSTHTKEALRLLDEHDISSMPVVDDDGCIVGVVSEADLLRRSVLRDPRATLSRTPDQPADAPRRVEDVMSRRLVTVIGDADVAEAVELMTSSSVKSLPVLDARRRPIGVISRHDVVHMLARPDRAIAADLDALFEEMGVDWSATVDDGHVTVKGPVGARAKALAQTASSTVEGVVAVRTVEPDGRSL